MLNKSSLLIIGGGVVFDGNIWIGFTGDDLSIVW